MSDVTILSSLEAASGVSKPGQDEVRRQVFFTLHSKVQDVLQEQDVPLKWSSEERHEERRG